TLHHLDLIPCHHAFRISEVFRVARRFSAVAKPAEVRTDDRESLCQYRRDAVPANKGLRVAVQKQDGKTAPTANEVDGSFLSLDLLTSEPIKHGRMYLSHHRRVCSARATNRLGSPGAAKARWQ